MVKRTEIDGADLERLIEAIRYVIGREGNEIDFPMVEYLRAEIKDVQRHLENEKTGDGDTTVSEIEAVLTFFQVGDE